MTSNHTPPPLSPILDSANPSFSIDSSILEIHPNSYKAQFAFDELVQAIDNKEIHPHQAHSMMTTGYRDLKDSYVSNCTDDDNQESRSRPTGSIRTGFFKLTFSVTPVTNVATWLVGRGSEKAKDSEPSSKTLPPRNRNVDILLAKPRSKLGRGLHSVHLYLRTHPESGVWMLSVSNHCSNLKAQSRVGGDLDTALCIHQPLLLNGELVKHAEERCLSEATFTLQIADLSYQAQFKIMHVYQKDSYIYRRNKFLTAMNRVAPPALISGIPFPNDNRNQLTRWRDPLANGAFGAVYIGFDPVTGDLRAIKTWNCKQAAQASQVMQEIEITAALSALGSEGIIRMFGWRNGLSEEVIRDPPVDYYMVMEVGNAFHKTKWSDISEATSQEWSRRKVLFRQLLIGLQTIHARDWIHRDITAQNIILVPAITGFRPEAAKLADFGKLCLTPNNTSKHLAAEKYRVPEVNGQRQYNQAIDIWGLALAVAYTWFMRPPQQKNKQGHAEIIDHLNEAVAITNLTQLVQQMLPLILGIGLPRLDVYNILLWYLQKTHSSSPHRSQKLVNDFIEIWYWKTIGQVCI